MTWPRHRGLVRKLITLRPKAAEDRFGVDPDCW